MGKKRVERRVAVSSDRRSSRIESANREEKPEKKTTESAKTKAKGKSKLLIFVVFFFVVSPAITLVVYTVRSSTSDSKVLPLLYRQGLVQTDVNYKEILTENVKVSENASRHRHFMNPVLVYVTPWNSRGYELTKRFSFKFTHISPVWYDLKSQGSELILVGRHNADTEWLSELRKTGHVQVLPRVVLDAIPMNFLTSKSQIDTAIELILKECREMQYDGIVLESWSRWAAYGVLQDPYMRSLSLQFIGQLGKAMRSMRSLGNKRKTNLQLVYVIGPPHSEKLQEHDFGPEDRKSLNDDVDGFSLMTYDFSSPYNPGPNAPLKWVRSTLQLLLSNAAGDARMAQKIFVGINFYGNDFVISGALGGGPIVGREYLSLLEKYKPSIKWERQSAEHYFLYSDDKEDVKHLVFYPSLMSIAVRLEEARLLGAGISIWELGQGLDYFLDIL